MAKYQLWPINGGYVWLKCPGCMVKEVVLLSNPWPVMEEEEGLSWEPPRMTAAEYCNPGGNKPGPGTIPPTPEPPGTID